VNLSLVKIEWHYSAFISASVPASSEASVADDATSRPESVGLANATELIDIDRAIIIDRNSAFFRIILEPPPDKNKNQATV
jgi:hypothetical protein